MKIIVFTAIYGKYDYLKLQPEQDVDVEYICFCDETPDFEPGAEKQWKIRKSDTYKHLSLRLQAKYFRLHPFTNLEGDIAVYIDGTTRFQSEYAVSTLVDMLEGDILMFEHPERDNIEDEAQACIDQGLQYKGDLFNQQVKSYIDRGYPTNFGLYATGTIIYRLDNKRLENMFNERWGECLTRTQHDQLSFPYLAWKHYIEIDNIKANLRDNQYLKFIYPHKRDDKT